MENLINMPKQLIFLGKKELLENKFNKIKNLEYRNKPLGGLWTSEYTPNNEFVSSWHEWCKYEMPHWISNDAIILSLKKDTKYFVINSQNDLKELINIVGENDFSNEEVKKLKRFTSINFEKASQLYNVIYLTKNGAYETHMPLKNFELNLYGWDVESQLIMNYDCIESWEYIKLNIV